MLVNKLLQIELTVLGDILDRFLLGVVCQFIHVMSSVAGAFFRNYFVQKLVQGLHMNIKLLNLQSAITSCNDAER